MKLLTPHEAVDAWSDYKGSHTDSCYHIYSLGVEHGRQQAAEDHPLWPEPITERRPTAEDADPNGLVQFQHSHGYWTTAWWHAVGSAGWQHTCNWQPKPPTLKEQALSDLRDHVDYLKRAHGLEAGDLDKVFRALEAQP